MFGGERGNAGGFQCLGDAMAVTLAGQGFVAGEGDALFVVHDPATNFFQHRLLAWQAVALVFGKKCVVIGLCAKLLAGFGFNAQLRQMLISDADSFAGVGECALGKTVFTAEGIATDIAKQGHGIAQKDIEITFETAPLVTNGSQSGRLGRRFGCLDFLPFLRQRENPFQNFAARGIVRIFQVNFPNERVPPFSVGAGETACPLP